MFVTNFVATGWLVPPIDCFFFKNIVFVAALWLLMLLFHHRLIVELLSLQAVVAVFVAAISWLLPLFVTTYCTWCLCCCWLVGATSWLFLFENYNTIVNVMSPLVHCWAFVTAGCSFCCHGWLIIAAFGSFCWLIVDSIMLLSHWAVVNGDTAFVTTSSLFLSKYLYICCCITITITSCCTVSHMLV